MVKCLELSEGMPEGYHRLITGKDDAKLAFSHGSEIYGHLVSEDWDQQEMNDSMLNAVKITNEREFDYYNWFFYKSKDYDYSTEDFVMPQKVITKVQKLSNHYPKKNEDKILYLMNEHGTDICNNTHEEDYGVFDWKHLGSDDEFEHHESCLGCGGLRE